MRDEESYFTEFNEDHILVDIDNNTQEYVLPTVSIQDIISDYVFSMNAVYQERGQRNRACEDQVTKGILKRIKKLNAYWQIR